MRHSKSALFLMELIIAIFFFLLASTVCIQLFAKSHVLSKQTVNKNHAVIQAQNLAECFLATEGNMDQMKTLIAAPLTEASENSIILFFDDNWKGCDSTNAQYSARLLSHPEKDGLTTADIVIAPYHTPEAIIYTLSIEHHIPERRDNHD